MHTHEAKHTLMYARTHALMHARTHTFTHSPTNVCMHPRTHARNNMCMHPRTCLSHMRALRACACLRALQNAVHALAFMSFWCACSLTVLQLHMHVVTHAHGITWHACTHARKRTHARMHSSRFIQASRTHLRMHACIPACTH